MRSSSIPCHALAVFACTMTCLSAAQPPVTVVFQQGLNSYNQSLERRIGKTASDESNGPSGVIGVDGGGTQLNDERMTNVLLRFGGVETAIPAGAKILNAKITLVTRTGSNDQSGNTFNVYRLTRPFTATSSSAGADPDFGTNGIEGDVDMILGSFHGMGTASVATVVSADVTRAVQSWVDGTAANLGVGIRADQGTDGWVYNSNTAGQAVRPKLEVTYILPVDQDEDLQTHEYQQGLNDYAGSADLYLNMTVKETGKPDKLGVTIIGSETAEVFLDGLNPGTTEPDNPGMLRFSGIETALDSRKIISAKLKIVSGFSSGNSDSTGPFSVHRLLVPFSVASPVSLYTDFAGPSGAMLNAVQIAPAMDAFIGMGDGEVAEVDITDAVKAWASGEPNHGLYIGSGTTDGWQVFTTGAPLRGGVNLRPLLTVISAAPLPIEVTAPTDDSRHVVGTPITFTTTTNPVAPATASKVEFFIDGVKIGEDTSAPFTWSYPASQLGNFKLTALLTDSESKVTSSEVIDFSVIPAAGTGGLYFDGITDHVAFGNPTALGLSTFTIETWFRRETKGVAATTGHNATTGVVAIPLIAKGRHEADNSTLDTNYFLGIRESDGVLCADFEGAAGANVPVAGRNEIPYGVWQHAAATFDGTKWRLYLNGNLEAELDAAGRTPRADSIQHASIATAMNSSGLGEGAFGGFMDEVRIWNSARTQDQIRAAINTEIVSDPALVARWAMTEGSGTTITSTASAGTVGNFSGKPLWTAGQAFSGNVLPSIQLTSPLEGANYVSADVLGLASTSNDPDGTPSKVEYFDNGVSIGVANSAPFSLPYANLQPGVRLIDAEVTDNNGGKARIDKPVTIYVSYPSPAIPGYSAGIINGGDIELFTGTPPAVPAPWAVVAGSSSPRNFTGLGTVSGDIAVNINGTAARYNAGLVLTSNAVVNGNFAANDNIAAPYADGAFYRVRNLDNNGPGETEPEVTPESSSFSLGWFPYANGWIGANVLTDGTIDPASSNLPAGVTITSTALGTYTITGLTGTGNLIAIATGAAADNFASTRLADGKWEVLIRDNNGNADSGSFAFLYVPLSANRVVSGLVDNAGVGSPLNVEAQLIGVNAELTPQGYQITFGDGSVINPSNTALFISAGADLGNGADNAYSYSTNGNSFVVFSHDLPGFNLELQTGGFRFLAVPMNPTNPLPVEVGVKAIKPVVSEDANDKRLVFTVTRSGSIDNGITVNYTLGGTAIAGSDYQSLPGSVLIPAGKYSADVVVNVLTDATLEPTESVILNLAPGTGYAVASTTSATASINDSAPVVTTNTVSFQQGVGGYTGSFQKRIGIDPPDNAEQTVAYVDQLGTAVRTYPIDGGDPDINDMMRFDNIIGAASGQIPAGARILKAELMITTGTGSNDQSGGPFIVDRLIAPFDASTTYVSVSGGAGYEGVRGISSQYPSAGFQSVALGDVGIADVTDIVRAWTAGETNHGFGIFAAGTSDAWEYCTISHATLAARPKLVVTYTIEATKEYTLLSDRSAKFSSQPGSSTQDGSAIEIGFLERGTNNTHEAYLKFPVDFGTEVGAIPQGAKIVKAELLMATAPLYFAGGSQTTAPVQVRQVLNGWNTSTNFGLHGPRIGTDVTESWIPMTGLGQGSTTCLDITSLVRNWQAGAPNHGIHFRTSTTDNWGFVWPGNTEIPQMAPRLRITVLDESGSTSTPFELWADEEGITNTDMDSDDDHDGIKLLVEYALGLSARNHDVLPELVRDGSNLTISFEKGTDAAADSRVTYQIMSSDDLVEWEPETSAVQTSGVISLNPPMGAGPKFFRLKVTYTP